MATPNRETPKDKEEDACNGNKQITCSTETEFVYMSNALESVTRCFKNLGHILTLNISKTTKDITTHLISCESLQSQVIHEMFQDFQCQHRWSHGTYQADSPILAKRAPASRCRWLRQLPLIEPSVHLRLLEGEANRPVLSQTLQKEIAGC